MQNPTWYNNQVHGCCNIAVQSCYFIIPWQHGSNNVVQVCSFIKPRTVCSNMHEQACQQHCSSWPAQPCSNWPAQPCSTVQACRQANYKLCVFTCMCIPPPLNTRLAVISNFFFSLNKSLDYLYFCVELFVERAIDFKSTFKFDQNPFSISFIK